MRIVDAHVVGDEVEHLAHFVRAQLRDPGVVILARSDRGVEFIMIGNFVTVQALGARLKVGRRVAVAHA